MIFNLFNYYINFLLFLQLLLLYDLELILLTAYYFV